MKACVNWNFKIGLRRLCKTLILGNVSLNRHVSNKWLFAHFFFLSILQGMLTWTVYLFITLVVLFIYSFISFTSDFYRLFTDYFWVHKLRYANIWFFFFTSKYLWFGWGIPGQNRLFSSATGECGYSSGFALVHEAWHLHVHAQEEEEEINSWNLRFPYCWLPKRN